jgi:queuine tRNA-ribosyltransferase
VLQLPHGAVETPIFMPVGTQATVKTLAPDELTAAGATIILANNYHLLLRPGPDRLRRLGGLHRFMHWPGNVLTDSGGYQVMSLKNLVRTDDQGVRFQSHLDGSALTLTPESVLDAQDAYGSDVSMVLDVCPSHDSERRFLEDAVQRTTAWARRSATWLERRRATAGYEGRLVFAINQGGVDPELRRRSAEELIELDFPGYALGGLMVGEPREQSFAIVERVCELLPADRPRYLMGVGTPEDIVMAVARGVDMFDCVLPTRNARNGQVFTRDGRLVIKNAAWKEDERPLDPDCDCTVCARFSRAYLRHLFVCGEILGLRLLTLHSVSFYLALMAEIRQSIAASRFESFSRAFLDRYRAGEKERAARDPVMTAPPRERGAVGSGPEGRTSGHDRRKT